jgi:hypothetical protein
MGACPLQGLVRSVAFPQETSAISSQISNTYAASVTFSTIAISIPEELNLRLNAEM